MSGPIFFQLIGNVIFFATSMWQADRVCITVYYSWNHFTYSQNLRGYSQSIHNMNISFYYNTACMLGGFMWSFLLCYYATLACFSIAEIGDVVYSLDWYRLPKQLKKCQMLIIGRSQRSVYFMGYKMVRCTLESFMTVRFLTGTKNLWSQFEISVPPSDYSSLIPLFRTTSCSGIFPIVEMCSSQSQRNVQYAHFNPP